MTHGAERSTEDQALYQRRLNSFEEKTTEQKVQELSDREEIRDLIAIYAHRMARGVSVADLFADDGAYVNRGTADQPPKEIRGRVALDEYYGGREGWTDHPLPMIHNHLIQVLGDEASGICSVEIRLSGAGESLIASGYYNDRFRRECGRWMFVERDCTFFHFCTLRQGWANGPK